MTGSGTAVRAEPTGATKLNDGLADGDVVSGDDRAPDRGPGGGLGGERRGDGHEQCKAGGS
ncbi:MAG TPA: hypothetical protein VMK53_09200 [Gemmatimonadales bacterium]|nr:hypothetical protein [Gemmatimonadales bacterium]